MPNASNLAFVEEEYFRWLRDPQSVGDGWRSAFEQLPVVPASAEAPTRWPSRRESHQHGASTADGEAFQARVDRLVHAYRHDGHLRAQLDPLDLERCPSGGFELSEFGLSEADLDRQVTSIDEPQTRTLRELVQRLEETYCRTLGVELAHIHDQELRHWLEQRMERTRNRLSLAPQVKTKLLESLTAAEVFESFLGARFLGAKRFSLEGADSLLPAIELIIDRAVGYGVRNIVIGMAHRGRLNVLANVLSKPIREIFAEFRDQPADDSVGGDVKYHLGYAADREAPDGGIHLSLAFNPSHLEWIDTVVQGRIRAKQDRYRDAERRRSLPLLIHGDAAFAGQGIVTESLNMSMLEGYTVGGTLHLVLNNQVGFTTSPRDGRSTLYPTDVALMLDIPIFHVNGEDLEAVAQAVLLAVDFRQRFHRDAVIDLWCYRKHGHNEGDEPAFTQPLMVRAIARKQPLRMEYGARLVEEGVVTETEVKAMEQAYRTRLEADFTASATLAVTPASLTAEGAWQGYRGGPISRAPDPVTAVDLDVLQHVGRHLSEVPPGFKAHPKISKILEQRAQMATGQRPLDWGMGEALALGSLAWQGMRVRLVGQDSRRGTFSHRHAVLHDQQTGATYMPLSHLREGQGTVEIRDSLLSEAGALGYEYGYSLEAPEGLVIWEAQFGDFVNAAQVIIDQFLSSSETKWNRLSGLVLLLPHGLEGQGPEHSSARLERFLGLSVDDNWQVVNLTTPAQLFHALRRQMVASWRKPLVVMSPKSLLRHPAAISALSDLTAGGFKRVLPDPVALDPEVVTRVCLCSGKIYYELAAEREAQKALHVALLRLEQLYPLREDQVLEQLTRFRHLAEVAWVQEEPRNMGAWEYVNLHLGPLIRDSARWFGVSRSPSSSPAAGSANRHRLEQQALVRRALGAPFRIRTVPEAQEP